MRIFAIPGDGEDKGPESIHLRDDEDNDSESAMESVIHQTMTRKYMPPSQSLAETTMK
jgi:hypothetical protein